MEGKDRRNQLLNILSNATDPVSGSELSRQLRVSRQVIVQDIALLRAENKGILSTTKGYLLEDTSKKVTRRFHVRHSTEEILDELLTIVDHGGKVLNVIVSHGIYGEITTELNVRSRQDAYHFVEQVQEKKLVPLKELTNNMHDHVVEADSVSVLDQIENALDEKKYLMKSN